MSSHPHDRDAAPREPTPRTSPSPSSAPPVGRRLAPLVPLLVVASAGLLAAHVAFSGDTFQHCHYLGPSTRMYLTAWAAPGCAVAAVVLLFALHRTARGRGGLPVAGRRRWMSTTAVCFVPLLLLVQLAFLYWVYQPDPSGGNDCSGLAVSVAQGW
ncbi:hypothetical protein HUT19_28170 [Streptomyces sp. NA02950]|uniref:hypothetical protein n=1 Tax=Streptomyces sp. NA02950 TaxID=2742137 RepID=UPI00159152E7|nr:hypothetical protein [Streptomyces sp. NA02950]QKV95137.1 hypothetical protein HUT19_28170 [Streptomyces sp. NA02950]